MTPEAAVKSCAVGRPYTIDALLEIDDGQQRFELLDGTLITSPTPGYDHQELSANLNMLLARRAP